MNRQIVYIISCAFVLAALLSSCDKEDDIPYAEFADIRGRVVLHDEDGNAISNADMTVKILGLDSNITTLTLENGNFVLKNVGFGVHTLHFTKPGFGQYRLYNVDHQNTGSTTVISDQILLGEVSTTRITNISSDSSGINVRLYVNTNPEAVPTKNKYLRIFIHRFNNVSASEYTAFTQRLISSGNPFILDVKITDFTDLGFERGDIAYIEAYGESYWTNEYYDPELERTVFPNVNANASRTIEVIVP